MKKIVVFMVTAMMVFALAGCGGDSAKDKVVGDWHLETIGEQSVADYAKANSVQENQVQTNYTFKEDGTGGVENVAITAAGADSSFKWEEKDGKIIVTANANGAKSEFTVDGDKLTSEVSGVKSTLVKGKAEIQSTDDLVNQATGEAQ